MKKVKWIYERSGKKVYRRPLGKDYPKQLIVLKQPIYNN